MKKTNDIIKKIPEYLTLFRLISIPLIIIFYLSKLYILAIIFILISSSTDFLDGFIAKKWLVESKKNKKLDITTDKIFIILILLFLCFKFHILIIHLVLEIIFTCLNLYYFNKTNNYEVLSIGKIKTVLLFLLLIVSFLCLMNFPIRLLNAFAYASINIQILSIFSYYINYSNDIFDKEERIEKKNRDKRLDDLENKTIMLDKIEDLLKDYEKNDIL